MFPLRDLIRFAETLRLFLPAYLQSLEHSSTSLTIQLHLLSYYIIRPSAVLSQLIEFALAKVEDERSKSIYLVVVPVIPDAVRILLSVALKVLELFLKQLLSVLFGYLIAFLDTVRGTISYRPDAYSVLIGFTTESFFLFNEVY